jgi:acetoin utilization deacetylase AcuC-like enzyme
VPAKNQPIDYQILKSKPCQTREETKKEGAWGLFFDCLPDVLEWCENETEYKQNVSRLKFYEGQGARPLVNFKYELPRSNHDVFYLMFDGLGKKEQISSTIGKRVVEAILTNKDNHCSPEYIKTVVGSIKSTLTLRPLKYQKKTELSTIKMDVPSDKKISLVVNEGHLIHHIKERGYLESPVRVTSILREIKKTNLFEDVPTKSFPDKHMAQVHDKKYLKFLKEICEKIGHSGTRYGDVFPIRNQARLPKNVENQIGYYCIDTSTPLNANAYIAARAAVDCALTAAELVLKGKHFAYALVRPPGHHAERKYFGGFCYLNSNAVAAHFLSQHGRVVILDIDYHHGNGQQDIFYDRSDVYTMSIHADPEYAYPNFTGFKDEIGEGAGEGFNKNYTMPEGVTGEQYHKTLQKAINDIKKFKPDYLIIALGLDIAKGDPTGTWLVAPQDFRVNGQMIASLNLPTVIVQEGGYQNKVLGKNARHFLQGLWEGHYK